MGAGHGVEGRMRVQGERGQGEEQGRRFSRATGVQGILISLVFQVGEQRRGTKGMGEGGGQKEE